MQDELVLAMTIEELEAFKTVHADNETIVKIVDGAIATKQAEALEALRWLPFYDLVDATIGTLPDFTPNWRLTDGCQTITIFTIEKDDTSDGEKEVVIDGVKVMRYPKMLERRIHLGGAVATPVAPTTKAPTSKGGNCYKRQQAEADSLIGHFGSCAEACGHLNIDQGKGSACAALVTNGYYFTKDE